MKKLALLAILVLVFGCTKTATSPILTPIQDVGCAIETAVTGGMAQTVGTALSCTNVSAIQASLVLAMGNVNICSTAQAATAQVKGQVQAKGIVGNLACPIAITTVVGFLTNSIPTGWGCSTAATVSALTSALTTACEAAIPI